MPAELEPHTTPAAWTPGEPTSVPSSPGGPASAVPEPRPGRAAARWLALFEVLICSGYPTQLLLMPMLVVAGLRPFDGADALSTSYIVTLSIADAFLLVSLIFLLLWLHGEDPRAFFLGWRPPARETLVGLLLIPAAVGFVLAGFAFIQQFAPWLHNVAENPLEALIRTPRDAVLFGAVSIVAGGVREEIQRAFVLRRFEQHLGGGMVGLVIFSAAFGAGHLIQGWDAALMTGLLGVFWGLIYLRRRSVVAPVVCHSGFNVAEIVRHIAMS